MLREIEVPRWPAVKIAGGYLIVGVLWILFSDQVLLGMFEERELLSRAQTYKGWLYVAITAILVFALVSRYAARIRFSHDILRENRRRLTTLLSNLPGMAYRCANDRNWTMEFVSQGSRELLEYEAEELVGNRNIAYADVIKPEDRENVFEGVQKALSEKRPYQLTYRVHTKTGREKWVWEQGRAVRDADGRELLEGFITDITQLKLAQEELSLRVRELTVVHDVCRRVNGGLSVEQAAAMGLDGLAAVVEPDLSLLFLRRDSDLHLLQTRLKTPNQQHAETPIHRVGECLCGLAAGAGAALYSLNIEADPRCTWEECKKCGMRSFAALPLRSGKEVIGVLGLGSTSERDFQRQATFLETLADEIALGVRNALLFQRVREHEKELEREVARRTAELKLSNEELEAFTYSVSHDLRAPVRHIDGFARLALDGERTRLSEDGVRQLEIIRNSARKMGSLIDDLLELSRVGRKSLEKQRVDSETLVREVVEELKGGGEWSGARFVLQPLPEAHADAKLIRQVWLNLVGNALKYTSTRSAPEIIIDAHVEGDRPWYRIRDNGVGFDPRYADKLFKVFQRLHRDDEFPGTGVGLAISARIIHKHGGQIRGTGAIGQGATFEFTLGEPDARSE